MLFKSFFKFFSLRLHYHLTIFNSVSQNDSCAVEFAVEFGLIEIHSVVSKKKRLRQRRKYLIRKSMWGGEKP